MHQINQNEFIGLSTETAKQRFLQEGPNFIEEKNPNQTFVFIQKFWAPIPWMLEITIFLEILLHKYDEAIIIAALLCFNACLSYFQESHANKALLLLRNRLAINARVCRDGIWHLMPAQSLVREDIVHLRMGDIAPADIKILAGNVLIDQSSLTGESMPVQAMLDKTAYSGSVIIQGEATGEVIATGKHTFFGKTVNLMQTAKSNSHIKSLIFKIVQYLFIFITALALLILFYSIKVHLPFPEIIPFILILFIAAIPVALPATFTLSTALGAMDLVKKGVLVTHLSALEEASVVDTVCIDKTGTVTQNILSIAQVYAASPYSEDTVLYYASLASNIASQDPIDQAIIHATPSDLSQQIHTNVLTFIPFDAKKKCTEAYCEQSGKRIHIMKGSVDLLKNVSMSSPHVDQQIAEMGSKAYRLLVVTLQENGQEAPSLVGIIGFFDPPREDSKPVIQKLHALGLRLLMLTGDNEITAKRIADSIGMKSRVCSSALLKQSLDHQIESCDVFANLFPEDKFLLVKHLQHTDHIVAMTGDGVNDAPSLKQSDVGISVSNAMDVAKAAASIVLTQPGLSGILNAIETSRRVYQRMHTYILNKISKSIEITAFTTLGIIFTGDLILTPLLMVLLMFTNDFVTMSIATDNATFSKKPERWNVGRVMLSGGMIGGLTLILSLGVLYYARAYLKLSLYELQTFVFVLLVFTAQCNVYILRERGFFWNSLPSKWLLLSTLFDIIAVIIMATYGILMTSIPMQLILTLLLVVVCYLFVADFIKVLWYRFFIGVEA